MKRDKFDELRFGTEIPEELEEGVLYISMVYGITAHLCPCGCGRKVVVDFRPEWPSGWDLTLNNGRVTMRPSIGNFCLPCKSHYYITENRIEWL